MSDAKIDAEAKIDVEGEIAALAKLSTFEYQQQRKEAATSSALA